MRQSRRIPTPMIAKNAGLLEIQSLSRHYTKRLEEILDFARSTTDSDAVLLKIELLEALHDDAAAVEDEWRVEGQDEQLQAVVDEDGPEPYFGFEMVPTAEMLATPPGGPDLWSVLWWLFQ